MIPLQHNTGLIIRNRCAEVVNSCINIKQLNVAINYSQRLIEHFIDTEYKNVAIVTRYNMRKYLFDTLTYIVKQKRKLLRSI